MKSNIESLINQTYTQQKRVLLEQTAASFALQNDEEYANVLATPYLIAEIERVCADIIKPLLAKNQVSVGAHIDIRHLAATAVGANYTISATLIEHKWGLFTFEIEAFDGVGKIAAGRIVRAIAALEKIQQRADQSL